MSQACTANCFGGRRCVALVSVSTHSAENRDFAQAFITHINRPKSRHDEYESVALTN